jgi:hypothetical protein
LLTSRNESNYPPYLYLNLMRITKREVKERQAALKASGHTKADVRRLAGVSERMVYFWYRGEKASAKIAQAHRALTGAAVVEREKASA